MALCSGKPNCGKDARKRRQLGLLHAPQLMRLPEKGTGDPQGYVAWR